VSSYQTIKQTDRRVTRNGTFLNDSW